MKIYICHAMTGRPWFEVKQESDDVKELLSKYGMTPLDPIDFENDVKNITGKIPNRPDDGGKLAWYSDKQAIRNAHVVLDITPNSKSEGVLRELGYARFFLWKPVIRVYKPGSDPHMITVFEDDVIVYSLEEAVQIIEERWGTWKKRFKWRIAMLKRSIPKFVKYQLLEFK